MRILKYLVSLLIGWAFVCSASADKIQRVGVLTMMLPDTYRTFTTDSFAYAAIDVRNESRLVIWAPRVDDFDRSESLESMDEKMLRLMNLKEARLVSSATESAFDWNQDYVRNLYVGPDSLRFVTFTFYTFEQPYCFFFTYRNEADLVQIEQVIFSVKAHDSFLHRFLNVFHQSAFGLILLFAIVCVVPAYLHVHRRGILFSLAVTLVFTFLTGATLLYTLWGVGMDVFATYLTVYFLAILCSAFWIVDFRAEDHF